MAGALNKVLDFLGMDTKKDEDIEETEGYDYEEEQDEQSAKTFFGKKGKVVPMNQGQQVRMVISQPSTFEQAKEIGDYIKEKKSVVLNLDYVSKDIGRRIIDFVSGVSHALDGEIVKVSNGIFLVTPSNYEITNEMTREEIRNKLSVSWLKN